MLEIEQIKVRAPQGLFIRTKERKGERGRERERERGREGSGYNNMALWCAVRSLIPRQRDEFDTKTDTLVYAFRD